jgi:hypothetical protein
MMKASAEESQSSDEVSSVEDTKSGGGWKLRLWMLCAMLILALAGMGLTQANESGAWEYWLFVVVVYAGLGLWRDTRAAKQAGRSITKSIGKELAHWIVLVCFLAVLLLLERRGIVNRDSASYFALMLLALSCVMAGVHIDWLLLVVGVVLTVMLVAMATLEQFSVWIIMILVACLATVFFYLKSKRGGPGGKTIE